MAHNHEVLDVRKNGAFVYKDAMLVDYRQQNLAETLHEISSQQNRLESLVRRALMDDERLLGQEKANIVVVLQSLIRNLTTLYLRLYDADHASEFPTSPAVSEGRDGFLVQGKMNSAEVNIQFSLKQWTNTYLEQATETLTAHFQAAARDRQLSLAEKVQLAGEIGGLLVQSIQAFYLMRSGAVFH